jgi:type III secretion protein HrpB1
MTDGAGIVAGMIGVLWAGARLDTLSDLQDLFDAIGVLDRDAKAPRVAIAWWHVRARAWRDALDELRCAERESTQSSLGTALTAVCLYALGDASWRTYAYAAAYQSDDAMATRTALALLSAPEVEPREAASVPAPLPGRRCGRRSR